MIKRRIAALGATAGLILMAGLASSATASATDDPKSKGVCVTSDGKTFEFSDAVPATKVEAGDASVTVERTEATSGGDIKVHRAGEAVPAKVLADHPEGAEAVKGMKALETVKPGDLPEGVAITKSADGLATTVSITCTAK